MDQPNTDLNNYLTVKWDCQIIFLRVFYTYVIFLIIYSTYSKTINALKLRTHINILKISSFSNTFQCLFNIT